jgi:Phage integrase family
MIRPLDRPAPPICATQPERERRRPVSERSMRNPFKLVQKQAGLKPFKMYLRHSFGTTLAQRAIDVRTIQALMRHDRITTTERYMAYRPQPELVGQITRALDPHSLPETVTPIRTDSTTSLLERLEDEIPAKVAARGRTHLRRAAHNAAGQRHSASRRRRRLTTAADGSKGAYELIEGRRAPGAAAGSGGLSQPPLRAEREEQQLSCAVVEVALSRARNVTGARVQEIWSG